MDVSRAVVEMVAGDVKTEASKKVVPLDDFMIEELLAWYSITPYKKGEDWVFASDSYRAGVNRGKQPYWPSTIMRHFIQPMARKVGIGNISWHAPYVSDTLACQRRRPQGRAGTAFVDQDHDGCLHVCSDRYQAESSVALGGDDCAETASPANRAGLTLHTVTWTEDARCL